MSEWTIGADNKSVLRRPGKDESFTNSVEMSGQKVSAIVTYGTDNGKCELLIHPVFPMLRKRPNDTKASYQCDFPELIMKPLRINGADCREAAEVFSFDGILTIKTSKNGAKIERKIFPSVTLPCVYVLTDIVNASNKNIVVSCDERKSEIVDRKRGCRGICQTEYGTDFVETTLKPAEKYTYTVNICGHLQGKSSEYFDAGIELRSRKDMIVKLQSAVSLDSGNRELDVFYRLAQLHAGENIFLTKSGLMHSPGGYTYYAAVWCNDEVEYAAPWFSYTGVRRLTEAGANAYRVYLPFMDETTYEPIPSSIIAEGDDYWDGKGDRGDAAMFLYGCSEYVLSCGREAASELWTGIKWCAEYCKRKINEDGVVASDSDELEGRFPSGKANLCTSTLAYAGFRRAAIIADAMYEEATAREYREISESLGRSIEKYFGAEIRGFRTYRYYDGNDVLRSWICMPLCVGLTERVDGTVDALLSEFLYNKQGILTAEGSTVVWDRSFLYAMRGIFAVGKSDRAIARLLEYVHLRLLGERVPYPLEAYPFEKYARQLSGESALFCRIFLNGILALEPEGFDSFSMIPNLPEGLDHLYLDNINAYGTTLSIHIDREGWSVTGNGCRKGKLTDKRVTIKL